MFNKKSFFDFVVSDFCRTFAAEKIKVEVLDAGLRGAYRLGNANNGDNAGSVYLNGNNAPTNANANYGVVLNRSYSI